jgi:GNAT superfamily N-acetyltransferase
VRELDDWLRNRARANEQSGASRTFVAATGTRAVGYYALTVGSIAHVVSSGRVRRNMPDPVPVAIVARLAVDQEWQGTGLGGDLLRDAVLRTLGAAQTLGIRALMTHALSDEARSFYQRYGFAASRIEPYTLLATMADLRRAFSHEA